MCTKRGIKGNGKGMSVLRKALLPWIRMKSLAAPLWTLDIGVKTKSSLLGTAHILCVCVWVGNFLGKNPICRKHTPPPGGLQLK